MRKLTFILILFTVTFIVSCYSKTNQKTTTDIQTDTTKSFKIDEYWVTPKPTFEFIALPKASDDTLHLVTCSEYVFSPFGILKSKLDLKTSLLKNFSITNRVDTMDNGAFEFQILKFKSNRLILNFDNDPDASRESYIFKGDINDSAVSFVDNIKIGMSLDSFCKNFFDNFPKELQDRFKVIVFETCLKGIRHIYNFDNKKLISVKFENSSNWKVNY